MASPRSIGIGLVLLSAIGFGSGGLFAKPVYALGFGALTVLSWRFLLGAVLAWAWVATRPSARRAMATARRRTVIPALLLGIVYVGNSGTYYVALETVPLSLAALIVYLYPPVVAVLALRFGRRLAGWRAWLALGIALLGVVLAVGGIDPVTAPPVAGLVLVVTSPLIYAGWIILAARLSGERADRTGIDDEQGADASLVTALMMSATAAVYWAAALATGTPVLPTVLPAEAWPGLLGVAVVATFGAVLAFYAGARRVGAAQASLISTVEPLWTILMAALLYGERLEPVQLCGGVFILAGVMLAQVGARGEAPPATVGAGTASTLPPPVIRVADE